MGEARMERMTQRRMMGLQLGRRDQLLLGGEEDGDHTDPK
jgi:hypothetical protein